MTTTIPSIHTYQQGEYERLVAQLACEHETWESVQPDELMPLYDALMRRDGSRPADTWDAFTYCDDDLPEGETALYMIRKMMFSDAANGDNPLKLLLHLLLLFSRNLSLYYDEHIRADFWRARATLEDAGKPWWKRQQFVNTRRMIRDRAEGEK